MSVRTGTDVGLMRIWAQRSRGRLFCFAVFWFAAWPILAITCGAINVVNYAATKDVPFYIALPGVTVGLLYLVPDFLVSAAILLVLSLTVFGLFGEASGRQHVLECTIAFVGISLGIALEFPAILNHPIFLAVRTLTLLQAYIFVFGAYLVLLGCAALRTRNLAKALVPGFLFVAFGWGLTQLPVPSPATVNQHSTVVLGIDSLGTRLKIGTLRQLAQENGGAFYEHAVTPGLLTNAVWTAIFEHRPLHDTGVLLTFQSPDWSRSPFHLITAGKRRGYQTWSFFTGQNTAYVGSMAGFDHDCSGPMGWLQYATTAAKNGSIVAPFIISRLPQLPGSRIPANQAGTYAFDLRAVVRSILGSHQGSSPVLAIAHLSYLHDEGYPRFAELPKKERSTLLGARVYSLQDLSGEWQSPYIPGDLIDLYGWKIQNVQAVVADEIVKSGFLDARNRNRLVILSDHGIRWRLTNEYFDSEGYYQVPLITFGLPVRDTREPISLLDVPNLLGFEDPSLPGSAAPVVEYTNFVTMDEAKHAVLKAKWTLDGRIDLNPEVTRKYLAMLKAAHPFAAAPGRSVEVGTRDSVTRAAHAAMP